MTIPGQPCTGQPRPRSVAASRVVAANCAPQQASGSSKWPSRPWWPVPSSCSRPRRRGPGQRPAAGFATSMPPRVPAGQSCLAGRTTAPRLARSGRTDQRKCRAGVSPDRFPALPARAGARAGRLDTPGSWRAKGASQATARSHGPDRRTGALAELKAATAARCQSCTGLASQRSPRWASATTTCWRCSAYRSSGLFSPRQARTRLRGRDEPHARAGIRRAVRGVAAAFPRRRTGGTHVPDRVGEPAWQPQRGPRHRRGDLQRGMACTAPATTTTQQGGTR